MNAEQGRIAFLQQAYRNNWQRYLASLRPEAKAGWDICVLTAGDERQAAIYRRQLAWRRESGLLPIRTRFEVIADPEGLRIGSGGATLRVLALLPEETRKRQRVLIIHSGGDSKRLPHCSAIGKLFARLPRELPDGRASTIFDEFLISLSGLGAELPPGALVASGDVLLVFDHLQISFQRQGVIGVAAASPVEMGTRHGVYVSDGDTHAVRAYLHKPSLEKMAAWQAISADGTVQIDTGLVWLTAETVQELVALARSGPVAILCGLAPSHVRPAGSLNLYGDLLLPLAASTTFEDYLWDTSDGPATSEVRAAREAIWRKLRGIPFTVERLQPAVFGHFGTSYEYWRMVAVDAMLGQLCGWKAHTAAWLGQGADRASRQLTLINAIVENATPPSEGHALITDSLLKGTLSWQGAAILSGVHSAEPLELTADLVVDQMPLENGYVTRVLGIHDDPKLAWDSPAATFTNRAWGEWLAAAKMSPEVVWPDMPPFMRTLWNARLYPVAASREKSLALSLPLQDPANAPPGWRECWEKAVRLSLAESFLQADGSRLLAEMQSVEDEVAARRFLAAVEAERPAAEAAALLGRRPDSEARRSQRAAAHLAQADGLLQLRGYEALAQATGDVAWEEEAFNKLAELIHQSMPEPLPPLTSGVQAVRVEAAARVDFGGGWTDTPPYSIERGGTVLNAAIMLRGAYPIIVEGAWLSEPKLVLESRDIGVALEPKQAGDLLNYANPADPFALLKAAVVLRGIIPADAPPEMPLAEFLRRRGVGLQLSTQTCIPRGSGLGSSSILGGAVLACLGALLGNQLSHERLFDEVLYLEQMLTTGGGWQDQVGGLTGGIKLVTTEPGLPQRIRVAPVALSSETKRALGERLLLVHTAQQRLAKNLLRAIMGRWMARDPEIVWILREIARLAEAMRDALLAGDLDRFGALLGEHWTLNKRMDPGCSNPFIDELFEIMRPYICGGKLAGAGGGGFAIVVARSAEHAAQLSAILARRYPDIAVTVWPSAIPDRGMVIHTQDAKG